MKHTLFLLLLLPSQLFAQNGWYIRPEVGIGFSNVSKDPYYYRGGSPKAVLAYNAELGLEIKQNRWLFSFGLGYLRTGYREPILHPGGSMDPFDVFYYFNHIGTTGCIGSELLHSDTWSLTVAVGAEATFNYSARTGLSFQGNKKLEHMRNSLFQNSYNAFSVFGHLHIELGRKINPRLSVFYATEFERMFTDMVSDKGRSQYNYVFFVETGVKWNLTKPSSPRNNDPHIGGRERE